MTKLEKVIKGLEICTSRPCYCTDCPYKKECCLDSQNVMEDALALLKEKEETELCDRCGRRRMKSNRSIGKVTKWQS